jgi:uncharacterized membrane protein
MSWVYLALISAVLMAVQRVFEKKLVGKISFVSIGWLVQLFGFPVILATLFMWGSIPDITALPFQFWWPLIIIWIILYPLQTYAFYRALHEGELSLVLPVMSITPIVNIFSGWIMLGEMPSMYGVWGIFATVVALYLLLSEKDTNTGAPRSWMPVFLMFIFAFSVAIGTTLDKVVLEVTNPYFYSVANKLGAIVVLFFMTRLLKGEELVQFKRKTIWTNFLIIGLISGVSYIIFMLALSQGPVAYVGAIKGSNLIFGSLLGIVFLHEKMTARKGVSYILMIIGILLISFA